MKRVLIVDDDKSFLLSLKDGLSVHSDSFQVMTAENGREAVSLLRALPTDLLVTDLKMPEMDGFELLAWLSRHQPKLPVIVLTAFSTPEIATRLAQMTPPQFLEKPLDFQLLQERIFSCLEAGDKSFIRGITLPNFLQLMHLEQKTCTLKVAGQDRLGYLHIRRGELQDAEYGNLKGEAAVLDIVSWDNTEIEMDGVCRSQQRQITMTLEHILTEALRLKDERDYAEMALQAVATQSPSGDAAEPVKKQLLETADSSIDRRPISAEKLVRMRLGEMLGKLSPVQEYAIFDQKCFLAEKNSGTCTLEKFDPAIYTHLIDMVHTQINFGSFKCLVLNTASRCRYLLFNSQQHRVVAKLQAGAQVNQLVREIKAYINR